MEVPSIQKISTRPSKSACVEEIEKYINAEVERVTQACLKEPGFWVWTHDFCKEEISKRIQLLFNLMQVKFEVDEESRGVHFRIPLWGKDAY